MKKYIIISIIGLIVASLVTIAIQQNRISNLKKERDKYRENTEILLGQVEQYATKDSLHAATVGVLRLKIEEYEKYRSADAQLIETLKTKNRELQQVTTTQLQTIDSIRATVQDSVYIYNNDTVELQCIDVHNQWFDLKGCVSNGEFRGEYESRESLLIAMTVQYKRFLGFLWKTNKVKNRKVDIISRNPNTKIVGFEIVEIEK